MNLDGFCCPNCHGPLAVDSDKLACKLCALGYPIEDGIPVLIPARAVRTEIPHD
ncbi:MAG: Trm112 family protein [Acidobacteriota bacterium]|nr:Trm112 family protein [Acidobacteriota bacterium]